MASAMFARRIRVEYEENGRRQPCPLKWLDSFSMRNFTNASVFDNTLPVGDGVMEIGTRVPVEELQAAMNDVDQTAAHEHDASRHDGHSIVSRQPMPPRTSLSSAPSVPQQSRNFLKGETS